MNPGSLILFAQQQPMANKPPANPEEALAFLAANLAIFGGVGFCILVIWLVVAVMFCLSMAKALNQVSESNRQMSPGLVWLFAVPCLHIIWLFFIVIWVPGSLKKEFEDRGMDDKSDYGKTMGLIAAILQAVNTVLCCIPFVNYCSWVFGLVGLVLWIIFWVQIAGYSAKLASGKGG